MKHKYITLDFSPITNYITGTKLFKLAAALLTIAVLSVKMTISAVKNIFEL